MGFVYFCAVSAQLKAGYPSVQGKGLYAESWTGYKCYQIYSAIPFAFELRTILDYTCSYTSLDIFQYWTLEDIHANAYVNRCVLNSRKGHTRGDKQTSLMKLL